MASYRRLGAAAAVVSYRRLGAAAAVVSYRRQEGGADPVASEGLFSTAASDLAVTGPMMRLKSERAPAR